MPQSLPKAQVAHHSSADIRRLEDLRALRELEGALDLHEIQGARPAAPDLSRRAMQIVAKLRPSRGNYGYP